MRCILFILQKRVKKLREERSAPVEGSDEPQVVDEDQLFLEDAGGLDKNTEFMASVHYKVLYMEQKLGAVITRAPTLTTKNIISKCRWSCWT